MTLAAGLAPAVATLLRGDGAVAGLVGARVFADETASAVFPYVALGPVKGRAWNAGGERGEEAVLMVHCYARKGAREEAMRLAALCAAALEGVAPLLEGARVVGLFFQDVEVAPLKDRETWRSTARFRALVEAS